MTAEGLCGSESGAYAKQATSELLGDYNYERNNKTSAMVNVLSWTKLMKDRFISHYRIDYNMFINCEQDKTHFLNRLTNKKNIKRFPNSYFQIETEIRYYIFCNTCNIYF